MFKKRIFLMFFVLLIGQSNTIYSQDYKILMKKADDIYVTYLNNNNLETLKQALNLYKEIADKNPNSYEANWKTAMACRELSERSKQKNLPNWKKICIKYGKMGMNYAEKAIKLNPKGVQGHFYYGLCVGSYSDGVSILTALKEGLKGKTQNAFETAYKIDKTYLDATPIVALGRFWEVLPWVAGRDKKKALKLYQEAFSLMPENSRYRPELLYYFGNLLVDLKKDKKRGIELLKMAANSKDEYFSKLAQDALKKYDNK